ncbi:hypothetical protein [Kallotenue papyrolyticum]|uniref:hypothetical protein n=1 Tax=Kallotenue papyrolyticum TaxID=1325125 RepID=UPI0004785AFE|nr:hypothetical protein [Kallotenue papyrolyticum]
MSQVRRIWVTEIHNVGGFFAGETITLSATPWPDGEELMVTIDEKALDNIRARHLILPEMLLELELSGERVDRARLLASRDRAALNEALRDTPPAQLDAPRIRAYRCPHCDVWVVGSPLQEQGARACALCRQVLD